MKNNDLSRREKLLSRLDAFTDIALSLPDEMHMCSSFEEYISEYALESIDELTDTQLLSFEFDHLKHVEYAKVRNIAVRAIYNKFYDKIAEKIGSE